MSKLKVAPWITPGAELKTRDGSPVRIYATDVGSDFPVHGALFVDGKWRIAAWADRGSYYRSGTIGSYDLMKPARRRVAYVSLDEQGNLHLSSDPTETHGRLIFGSARVEVVEGEFAAAEGEEPL